MSKKKVTALNIESGNAKYSRLFLQERDGRIWLGSLSLFNSLLLAFVLYGWGLF